MKCCMSGDQMSHRLSSIRYIALWEWYKYYNFALTVSCFSQTHCSHPSSPGTLPPNRCRNPMVSHLTRGPPDFLTCSPIAVTALIALCISHRSTLKFLQPWICPLACGAESVATVALKLTKTDDGASSMVVSDIAGEYRWFTANIGRSGCVAAIFAIIFGVCAGE